MQFAYVSSRALMFPPNAMIRGELDLVNRRQTSHSYAQGAGRGTQEDACTIRFRVSPETRDAGLHRAIQARRPIPGR